MSPPTVAIYVSGHGYGHSVRSAQVASELLGRGMNVVVRTDAPAWLFPPAANYVKTERPLDVGVAQHDGLELDIDQTRRRWNAFANVFDIAAAREALLLHEHKVDFVLADVPPLAFAAASTAGIHSAGMTNFGWDWIYGAWPDFVTAIDIVQDSYRKADVLFRLPLHSTAPDAFAAFRTIEDVPLIARTALRSRTELRAEYGIPQHATAVLLSFGGFGVDGLALPELEDVTFVATPPFVDHIAAAPNLLRITSQPSDYVSLLAACDVVVTKPGYGIVADCLANRVAVLYTDRGPFREYDDLVAALHQYGRAEFVPRDDLLAGHLRPYLARLEANTTPWAKLPMNGAQVVADRVQERLKVLGKAVT